QSKSPCPQTSEVTRTPCPRAIHGCAVGRGCALACWWWWCALRPESVKVLLEHVEQEAPACSQQRRRVAALLVHQVGTPKNVIVYPKHVDCRDSAHTMNLEAFLIQPREI